MYKIIKAELVPYFPTLLLEAKVSTFQDEDNTLKDFIYVNIGWDVPLKMRCFAHPINSVYDPSIYEITQNLSSEELEKLKPDLEVLYYHLRRPSGLLVEYVNACNEILPKKKYGAFRVRSKCSMEK